MASRYINNLTRKDNERLAALGKMNVIKICIDKTYHINWEYKIHCYSHYDMLYHVDVVETFDNSVIESKTFNTTEAANNYFKEMKDKYSIKEVKK